jgi:CRISPR-associated RAMP protein (TIGR02581 family)
LRIGTGRALDAGTASDLPVMKDIYGRPFIPGSSLKGVLRSQVEALVRGLDNPGFQSCDPVGENWDNCVNPKEYSKAVKERRTPSKDIPGNLCRVCNLFGHPNFASRLRFKDLPVEKSTWHEMMLQVRDGVAIDRETGTVSGGKKYDFEVVPPGVKFALKVTADNVEDWQLGLLFSAFQMFNDGITRLGGATSRGLGSVEIAVEKYLDATADELLSGAAQEKSETGDVDAFRQQCLAALQAELKPNGGANE